jgi:hypothetical protein
MRPHKLCLKVHSDRSASTGSSNDARLAAGTAAQKAVSSRQPTGITMLTASVGYLVQQPFHEAGQIEPTCQTDDNPNTRHQGRVSYDRDNQRAGSRPESDPDTYFPSASND